MNDIDTIAEGFLLIGDPLASLRPAIQDYQAKWTAHEEKVATMNEKVMRGVELIAGLQAKQLGIILLNFDAMKNDVAGKLTTPEDIKEAYEELAESWAYFDGKRPPEAMDQPQLHAIIVEPMMIWDDMTKDVRKTFASQDDIEKITMLAAFDQATHVYRSAVSKVWNAFAEIMGR